jgi:hypothetical protein
MEQQQQPSFAITEGMLKYLDELRESGVTNMFGAAPYVQRRFPQLDQQEARKVLSYWMQTFATRHPRK